MNIDRDDSVMQHRIVDHDRLVHNDVLTTGLVSVALLCRRSRLFFLILNLLPHLFHLLLLSLCILRTLCFLNSQVEQSRLLCVPLLGELLALSCRRRHQVDVGLAYVSLLKVHIAAAEGAHCI